MRVTLQDFTKTFGNITVIDKLNLTVEDGEMMALLGPSGCGKSTTLFAICGVHRVNGGRILFGDRDVSELPSQRRNVGVVFQNYALYPHLTVFDNIAFPLSVRKIAKADIEKEVRAIASLTHIEELLERRPGQLSGGQQQRVALARALVRKPDVLLLDEPLANLDAKLRLEMRSEIRRIQLETGISAILVTHDQVEAMSMCDRIAIMNQGEIVQVAKPDEMYRSPVNQFVAGFLGNPPIAFVHGRSDAGVLHTEGGLALPLPDRLRGLDGRKLTVGVRPEHFGIDGDVRVAGKVSFVEPQGRETLFDVRLADGSVLRSVQASREDVKIGDEVTWPIRIDRLLVFDEMGSRL